MISGGLIYVKLTFCFFSSTVQPIFFTAAYSLSTPIGIAIGIALFSTFNPNSPTNLLTVGIIEALCGGVMVYDALVNMITSNILYNKFFYIFGPWSKIGVFAAMWSGAGIMAVIGKWA
jgi:zinc transporter 1/2/3